MPEEIHTTEPTQELSVADRFVGILTSPGEVYQTIASTEPKASNWSIPFIVAIIMSLVFTFVVFTQPAIQDEMVETQRKQMEKQVAEGKMTQEQVDKAMEFSKPGSPMFLVFGAIGVIIAMAFALFVYTLVYWLIGKIAFQSAVTYGKVLEVYGLSWYITPVTTLVTMVIVIAMGSLYAQPAASLFVSNFDPTDKVHKMLAAVNIFEFWMMYVAAVGLSKIWNVSFGKAIGVVGGVFVVWTLIKVFVGVGFGM
ncbi:MAG: YIP1 family protein [Bacteroidota bacterium]